ncbi:MAG: site-2 protease family protein [Ilumatobacter sp.]|uniref:site-2 protease family protein n=1 Tax=Ilumatobacter sp. TaxID=1967498 RepID=UPI00260969CA|nr:site-2 protease family protein [Ilumatobacter sp.]MDJ0767300.1 site-2 protease family protein [Ilumatobacter sp.]
MNTGSLKLGKILGIDVNIHWSVGLIAVLLGASLAQAIGWFAGALGLVAFLASILVHEFAHALTARRFGVDTESIQLWALGGVARLSRESPTAKAEGWIAAAGPLGSVAVSVLALGAWWLLDGAGGEIGAMLGWLGLINALLAVFNLLPGAPLDGGRILKAVRWARHGDRHRAAQEAGRAGMVLGWMIAALGMGLILREQSGIWLMITGAFIAVNARVEITAAGIARRFDGIKVRDLTWFGVAEAGTDMDADSMLWQRTRLGLAGGVAVTDERGRPQGLVLEDELWSIPADERPWVMLTQMMVPFDRTAKASPDEDLSTVLPRLNPARPVVTVWENDRLIGMVPPRRLREQLSAAGL